MRTNGDRRGNLRFWCVGDNIVWCLIGLLKASRLCLDIFSVGSLICLIREYQKAPIFFLRGIVLLIVPSPSPAFRELMVGMMCSEMYDSDGWLCEMTGRRDLLLRLKRYALLYGCFAALLRSNIQDARTGINTLKTTETNSPPDPIFSYLVRLLDGTYHQFCGKLDQALESYSKIPPEAGDIYILSLLNSTLILRQGTPAQQSRAKRFVDEIERRILQRQPSPQLEAAYHLIRGVTNTELLTSKSPPTLYGCLMVRASLDRMLHLASEQTNTQLQMLALGVMTSRYFINTSTEQAEKMGLMVYVNAKKGKDELWQLFSGNLLAGIPLCLRRES